MKVESSIGLIGSIIPSFTNLGSQSIIVSELVVSNSLLCNNSLWIIIIEAQFSSLTLDFLCF